MIENWQHYKETLFYNFNCRITRNIVNSGNFQLINGTCAHQDTTSKTMREEKKCPALKQIELPCHYNYAIKSLLNKFYLALSILVSFVIF